jgi:hypothetical protein
MRSREVVAKPDLADGRIQSCAICGLIVVDVIGPSPMTPFSTVC